MTNTMIEERDITVHLKRLRKLNKLTQKELALRIGATPRQVGGWERSEIQLLLEDAWKIADEFNCTLDELAGRTPPEFHEYADFRQENMNKAYESMSEEGKNHTAKSVVAWAPGFKKHDMAADEEEVG